MGKDAFTHVTNQIQKAERKFRGYTMGNKTCDFKVVTLSLDGEKLPHITLLIKVLSGRECMKEDTGGLR